MQPSRYNRRWIKALIIIATIILGLRIFAANPFWVENYYSQGLYPFLFNILNPLTRILPFSLFEVIVYLLLLLFTAMIVRWTFHWLKGRITFLKALGSVLLRVVVAVAGIYAWFLLCWGLNYYRVPLPKKLEMDAVRATEDQFAAAACWATEKMVELYGEHITEGVEEATRSALASLDEELRKMSEKPSRTPVHVKHYAWNYPMESTRTYGMISPWTLELHISRALFPVEIPFIAAHEAAHIRGYSSEAEANFLAFEACLNSDHPLARFSGFFHILTYLCHTIPHDLLVELYESWPDGIKRMEKEIEMRDHRHAGAFLDGVRIAYDIYLKFNAVPDGIRSYSRAGGWVAVIHEDEARAFLKEKK